MGVKALWKVRTIDSEQLLGAPTETTIGELVARYSVILFDSFGVLADSHGSYPGAVELIGELNRARKPYYVLTNDASALPETRSGRYRRMGLDIAPDAIITSGSLLVDYFREQRMVGARCVVLGPDDSRRYVTDAGGLIAGPSEQFDAIVIGNQSGFPFVDTIDEVMSALFRRIDAGDNVRLVLPNPDLIYPTAQGGFGIASASVALLFEAALELRYPGRPELRFERLGKPHPAMFEEARRRAGTSDMVMIGDQPETDIRGANAFGIHSALVDTGIAGPADAPLPPELRPTYHLRGLT